MTSPSESITKDGVGRHHAKAAEAEAEVDEVEHVAPPWVDGGEMTRPA